MEGFTRRNDSMLLSTVQPSVFERCKLNVKAHLSALRVRTTRAMPRTANQNSIYCDIYHTQDQSLIVKAHLSALRVRTVRAKCSAPPSGMSSRSTDVSTM